jgi:hypothetical protein
MVSVAEPTAVQLGRLLDAAPRVGLRWWFMISSYRHSTTSMCRQGRSLPVVTVDVQGVR